jgi:hypothetical protein
VDSYTWVGIVVIVIGSLGSYKEEVGVNYRTDISLLNCYCLFYIGELLYEEGSEAGKWGELNRAEGFNQGRDGREDTRGEGGGEGNRVVGIGREVRGDRSPMGEGVEEQGGGTLGFQVAKYSSEDTVKRYIGNIVIHDKQAAVGQGTLKFLDFNHIQPRVVQL